MKKILCVLCLLLLCSPAFAVVQGDEQFVYSSDIDSSVNENLGDETNPVFKYTSVTNPTVTLRDLDTIFPSRLAGMAFTASYTPTGKTAIYPGFLTLQFSREEITGLPNGQRIMAEMEAAQDPFEALFKYFDPVFVLYGTNGERVSVNVKNYPFNFTFTLGDFNVMSFNFPVVLADGYPETFCIESIGEYPAVYDAMVSETNAGVIGDGNIEVAFALVPNEKAVNATYQEYPVLEVNGDKGYVIFDDPSKYLDIPEMSSVVSATVSSGSTAFADRENGFSFEAGFVGQVKKNATLVSVAVHSENTGTLAVNGHPVETGDILLPDGTRYLTAEFVLVNSSFVTGAFVSGETVYVFDGTTDGVLSASVEVVAGTTPEEMQETLFYHDRGSFRVMNLEGLEDQAESISGSFSPATLPLLNGMTSQVSAVEFTGNVTAGASVYGIYEFSFFGSDVPDIDPSLIQEGIYYIFDYIRPVLYVGDVGFDVYDYLQINGRMDLLSVSGSLQAGFSLKVPVVLSDEVPFGVSLEEGYLHISDGSKDGVLSVGSYVGVVERPDVPEEPVGEYPVLSAPNLNVKRTDLGYEPILGLQEADAAFEFTGLSDWPGKDGVIGAVSAGSFVGSYDGSGKYVPLKIEISVSASDLNFLSQEGYDKVLAAWNEDRSVFLDYFHVYKQVDDLIYDLVMTGGKNAFTVMGDPTAKIILSFNAVLIDDMGSVYFDESLPGFVIYDGQKDGKLTGSLFVGAIEIPVEVEEPEVPLEELLLTTPTISLTRTTIESDPLPGRSETRAEFVYGGQPLWPGKAGVSDAVSVGSFNGTYEGDAGKYIPLKIDVSVDANVLQNLSADGYNKILNLWSEDKSLFLDYFHIYEQAGDIIYDLVMIGGKEALTIAGDPTSRIVVSFKTILVDDVGSATYDDETQCFIIYDDLKDGILTGSLFVGALKLPVEEEEVDKPVFSSPGISLKLTNIDTSFLYGLEEAEADFEYLGLTDWPGKDGVLSAVSVGSFEGNYGDPEGGKYAPLKMEVSVTSYDLDRLSKERHSKIISMWAEDRAAFLNYFHVYKQTGDLVYDLVMMGGKDAFTVTGDPTTKVTVSFNAILIDDVGNIFYDENTGSFVIYDGQKDGRLVDPLFVGTPETVTGDEDTEDTEDKDTEDKDTEDDVKHILPDNPAGASTGHDDLGKWFSIISLF